VVDLVDPAVEHRQAGPAQSQFGMVACQFPYLMEVLAGTPDEPWESWLAVAAVDCSSVDSSALEEELPASWEELDAH